MIQDAATAARLHGLLEYAGIALGMALYRQALRAQHGPDAGPGSPGTPAASLWAPGHFAVLVGLLLGAAIGNKLVYLIERPDVFMAWWTGRAPLQLGQSIVGGLLGGLVGVELAKVLTRQHRSTGDLMVQPLLAGMMLGRVGCWLAGLHDDTYGLPTTQPWGMDLGDGVPRHPSALYDIAFLALLGSVLRPLRPRLALVPGLQFKLFLAAYLLWRLLGDGLKPVRVPYAWGWSGIQWVCAVALLLYGPLVTRAVWQARRPARQGNPS